MSDFQSKPLFGTSYYCGCWWAGDPKLHPDVCVSHHRRFKTKYYEDGTKDHSGPETPQGGASK